MHEYGLAGDIVDAIQAEAGGADDKRFDSVEVEVGALARLEADTLAFWLAEELAEHLDDSIGADQVSVRRAPMIVACHRCGAESAVTVEDELGPLDPLLRRCPACESDDVAVEAGTSWTIRVAWA